MNKISDCGNFKTRTITHNCKIIEAIGGDIHEWGNEQEVNGDYCPAFIAYFGFSSREEGQRFIEWLMGDGFASKATIRVNNRERSNGGYPWEVKAWGMSRDGLELALEEIPYLGKWQYTA
jgi:hypothetical protein